MSTITASSASRDDVAAAVATALGSGDDNTVVIPGTVSSVSWTAPLVVNLTGGKSFTLRGATTITGNRSSGFTINDLTVIKDNVTRVDGNALLFEFQNVSAALTIQGISIVGDTLVATNQDGAPIRINGDSNRVRMSQCHFNQAYSLQDFMVLGRIYGVAYNCVFDSFDLAALVRNGGIYDTYGNESWTLDPRFGTENFWFFEDCWFHNNNPLVQTHANIDCARGGRYVARRCLFTNSKANTHGTETYGRERSTRATEVYENTFAWSIPAGATRAQIRGGTSLQWGNTYTNFESGSSLRIYRMMGNFVYSASDGTSLWDDNDSHGVYVSGTVASAAGGGGSLTVSGSPWTINQWVGYVIRDITSGHVFNSFILSNTANTITYFNYNATLDGNAVAHAGDTFEIRKVNIALDQPGRGKGDLIDGTNLLIVGGPNNGIAAWPRQALEPVMCWDDTNNGNSFPIGTYGEPTLLENRDYYNRAPQLGDYCYPYTPYTYPHPLRDEEVVETPDTESPTATLSPAEGATISGTTTLSATGSDNVAVVGGQFKVDGTNSGSEISGAGPFSRALNTALLTNGSHTVSITVRDAAGNSATVTHNVIVYNAPAIPVIIPSPGTKPYPPAPAPKPPKTPKQHRGRHNR